MSDLKPVPPCKGCGSTHIKTTVRAVIYSTFDTPLGIDEYGDMVFRYSNLHDTVSDETYTSECEDCGRGVRNPFPPVERRDLV